MEHLYSMVEEVLEKYDINYEPIGVEKNLDTWKINKSSLLRLLRKHPNWNEEALAIIFEVTQKREIEGNKIYYLCANLRTLADEILSNHEEKENFNISLNYLTSPANQYINENIAKRVNQASKTACVSGQKTSRVVNKLCKQYGVDKHTDYNAHFALLADALNPLEVKRKALLSIHPSDFLEMSNKDNSWTSCHNLQDGAYCAGTLSYMNDEVSMIFYTIDNDVKYDFFAVPKRNREVFCYENGILLQSRLYPDYCDEDTKSNFRNIVQAAIAVCIDKPNLWKLIKDTYEVGKLVQTNEDAHHYADYEHSQYEANVSLLKGVECSEENSLLVGHTAYCLECGNKIDKEDKLHCNYCNDDFVCDDCGRSIDDDSSYPVDGYYYCSQCVSYCEECDSHFRSSAYTALDSNGNDMTICQSCHDNFIHCESCNDLVHEDNIETFNNCDYCPNCIDEAKAEHECEDCAGTIGESNRCEVDGHFYCRDCVTYCEDCDEYFRGASYQAFDGNGNEITICDSCRQNFVYCENCNDLTHEGNIELFNECSYCSDCFKSIREENEEEIKEEYEHNCSKNYIA